MCLQGKLKQIKESKKAVVLHMLVIIFFVPRAEETTLGKALNLAHS